VGYPHCPQCLIFDKEGVIRGGRLTKEVEKRKGRDNVSNRAIELLAPEPNQGRTKHIDMKLTRYVKVINSLW
jgi:hypothetical protein